ncbi:Alpha/beta knot methyltransferase [Tirmania nivea]|nr:Alpha/beta knot methyltransferase [Tirmania nivea]
MTIRRHIPHVAKNSEFIFGTSVVEAAIKSHRRKLFRLYVYAGSNRTREAKIRDEHMKKLARKHHPDIEIVDEIDIGQLDSMSDSRPHNGYVLDAEKLHKVPLLTLGKVSEDCTEFGVQIAQHTTNPDIRLRDQSRTIKCRGQKRYPFVLMVDEILDPGNLGAIIRSAYYLGAEAVIISGRNSAPLSAVCLKASAGASEYIPIYEHTNSTTFLNGSKANGWKFYAAVPPVTKGDQKVQSKMARVLSESQVGRALFEGPCCLILGQEGEGLRPWLAKQANYQVGIAKGGDTDPMVDSLNVSVAAAILCNRFLNPTLLPNPQPQSEEKTKKEAKHESGPENKYEPEIGSRHEIKSQPDPNKLF